jgi:hypothetical protein
MIIAEWVNTVKLLKSIGFKVYDPNDDDNPCGFEADFDEQLADSENIIMLEARFSRNMFCIVLKPEGDFEFWVMNNVACGWTEMPIRWTEVSLHWINSFKKAFEGRNL